MMSGEIGEMGVGEDAVMNDGVIMRVQDGAGIND
jgi:hypothetical protein